MIDREIIKEKTGKQDKKGKDITKGVVAKQSRKITFRDDNYSIDSKSRFADIIAEIPFEVDALIQAMEDAIKAEQSKSSKSYTDAKKEQDKVNDEIAARIAKKEEEKREEKELSTLKAQIVSFIKENKDNLNVIKPVLKACKELGYEKPTDIALIEDANKILELIKS